MRALCRTDLYFLLRYVCGRQDMERQWLFERCREVQASPYGHLDLWAREHYKSTIITFGHSIQEILQTHGENPTDDEVTIGIFSHTHKIAIGFLSQIKRELETNQLLIELFPDILYENPDRDAPSWSITSGLIVRRKTNPKEPTVSAWGLVDGMPVSKHFSRLVYDDVVAPESISTPEQIQRTTTAWELSGFLGTEHGKAKYIGTRYHQADTYSTILKRKVVTPRIYPATDDGTLEGKPVFLSEEKWRRIIQERGPYVVACQMLQDPRADKSQTLDREWLNYWDADRWHDMNVYILCDPANTKRKKSDWTAIAVVGLGHDRNKYWIDGVRDRLNLSERAKILMALHRKYQPLAVGYEQYGMQADIEYIQREQNLENYRFEITPLGSQVAKTDRIKRLVPDLAQGKWYWPRAIWRTLYDQSDVDIVEQTLLEEYDSFPVPVHDDMLDCMSRIYDDALNVAWPREYDYGGSARRKPASWMTR